MQLNADIHTYAPTCVHVQYMYIYAVHMHRHITQSCIHTWHTHKHKHTHTHRLRHTHTSYTYAHAYANSYGVSISVHMYVHSHPSPQFCVAHSGMWQSGNRCVYECVEGVCRVQAGQGYVENMLREFDHVLTLRVRMPIDGDVLCNKRNFIYKIAHYNKAIWAIWASCTANFIFLPILSAWCSSKSWVEGRVVPIFETYPLVN